MPNHGPTDGAPDSAAVGVTPRPPAAFRLVWVPALVALVALEMLVEPFTQRPVLLGFMVVVGALATVLVLIPGLSGRRRLVFAIVCAALLTDVAAITTPLISSSGNDTAQVAPFLGALLFASVLQGRRLLALLGVQWLCGMLATWIAYGLSDLRFVPNADSLVVSMISAGALTLVEYTVLWWVRFRLTTATAQAAAAASEARSSAESLRSLIASSPLPAVVFGPDRAIRFANAAAEHVLGITGPDGDPAGTRPLTSIPEEWLERALRGGAKPGERASLQLADGRHLDVELHAAPEYVEGQIAGVICQVVDVTEREALAERRATAERLETVGRMAGGVAHDFNNLLTAVAGHAELVLQTLPPEDPAAADAAAIRDAASRGADLVRRLLTFARREELEPQLVDVNALVASLEPMLSRLIGTEVTLRFDLLEGSLPVVADGGGIEQVLVNLALNARDAMPSGGDLRIRTSIAEAAGTSDEGPSLAVIEVIDRGTGMDQATLDHIFEPFFTTKPGKGTGLGLTTALSIVEGSGGALVADSRLGKGSVFCVTLPVAHVVAEAPRREQTLPGGGASAPLARVDPSMPSMARARILVVDDEPALRTVTSRMLGARGYLVETASGAATALAAISEQSFDLVLTDMVMPDVRGPVLANQLRALAPGVRVAYMSGYVDDGEPMADDAYPCLGKPFDGNQLEAFVAAALESA